MIDLTIECKDEAEKSAIARFMSNRECRAMAVVFGLLAGLPSDRDRERTIRRVLDALAAEDRSNG